MPTNWSRQHLDAAADPLCRSPDESKMLPPPSRVNTIGQADQAAEGVTLGEIESLRDDAASATGLRTLGRESLLAGPPMRHARHLPRDWVDWSVDQSGSPVKVGRVSEPRLLDLLRCRRTLYRTACVPGTSTAASWTTMRLKRVFASTAPTTPRDSTTRDTCDAWIVIPSVHYVDFDQQPTAPLPGPPGNFRDMKEDLTVGDDFAIRVQQLNTSFQGRLTDHVNWRLNVWGMRKHGERQAAAMAHCLYRAQCDRCQRQSRDGSGLPRAQSKSADRLADGGDRTGHRRPIRPRDGRVLAHHAHADDR